MTKAPEIRSEIGPFDTSGYQIETLTLSQINIPFTSITDVYVSPSGQLYILDDVRHYFYRFDSVSGVLDSLGGQGSGNYQLNNPVSIDATNDLKIFVSDKGNSRIQMFDRRFQYLGTYQKQDNRNRLLTYEPTILCVNRVGELHFWDDSQGIFFKTTSNITMNDQFSPSFREITGSPSDCAISDTTIFLLDSTTSLIHRYNEFGRYLGFLGGFGKTKSITVSDDTLWILTDEHVIMAGLNGSINRVFHTEIDDVTGIRARASNIYLYSKSTIYTTSLN
jgi:hypothetical protein